jgi:hypothetical protein
MSNEKVLAKIKKCFALSKSDNEHEATSAVAMAQKLMAKHGFEEVDLETDNEADKIVETKFEMAASCKWKYRLATVVANNFRCKSYLMGSTGLCFYGFETDTLAAKEAFKYLFAIGHKLALKERAKYKKVYGYSTGIYNSFTLGFIKGINTKLQTQASALMIITSPEVIDSFEERTKAFKTKKSSFNDNINNATYQRGVTEGKSAMGKRELEG